MICPSTLETCISDLCYGSGCMEMDGYGMLAQCDICGGLIDEEIAELSTCTCDDGDYGDYGDLGGHEEA